MKKIMIFVGMISCYSMGKAQVPTIFQCDKYEKMVEVLEGKVLEDTVSMYMLPAWQKDTIVSTGFEISKMLKARSWDTAYLIERKVKDLSYEQLSFPEFKVSLPAKYGNKKPVKRREYYEEQRLSTINVSFDAALADKDNDKMQKTIDLMIYYLQHSSLLSKENYKDYNESFDRMRNQYTGFLSDKYKKNECQGKDFSRLFDYYTLLPSDLNVEFASVIMKCRFNHIEKYLKTDKRGSINLEDLINYYLINLKLCNLGYLSDKPVARQDLLISIYKRMSSMYDPFREYELRNLRRYTDTKFGIALSF
ncbi:TPA: hypothetical protein DEP21_03625 [Patescibacteria group bacterium]|nr:hypothetical protein [Candidatus Gracilibacteria bacterium]